MPSPASVLRRLPLLRRERLDRERMNLAPDLVSQRLVDHLVPRQAAFAGKSAANNHGLVVALTVGNDAGARALKSLLDQAFYFFRIHNSGGFHEESGAC